MFRQDFSFLLLQGEKMVAIRNWKDSTPVVAHDSAIVWRLFLEKGNEDMAYQDAPLEGIQCITLHRMQAGKSGDYHLHEDREQVYYFTDGCAKMKIDDVIYPVKKGDAVCVPPKARHQLINDSDDWVEHLIVSAWVR